MRIAAYLSQFTTATWPLPDATISAGDQAFAREVEFGEFRTGFWGALAYREGLGHSPLAIVYGIKAALWIGPTDRIFAT